MTDENLLMEELLALFESQDEKTRDYFASNIEWLKDRQSYWQRNYIRIGLIGITSCGKSTLLNALFGEELLPRKVRPSSGVLVTCVKDLQRRYAKVYFYDRDPEEITENIGDELAQYADEANNLDNIKSVKFIDIHSPDFSLSDTIQIVDSPGLDAVEKERHEKLTLETLLPSVDICIYMEALKHPTGKTAFEVLKIIQKHEKPLILVQNMKDSIGHLPGAGGSIKTTKEEVLQDHYQRLKKTILAIGDFRKQVPILQIEAYEAFKGRCNNDNDKIRQSAVPLLIDCIQQKADEIRPILSLARIKQVKAHIKEIIIEENKRANDFSPETPAAVPDFSRRKHEWESQYEKCRSDIKNICESFEKVIKHANSDLAQLYPREIAKAENIVSRVCDAAESTEVQLVALIKCFNEKIDKLLQELNLNRNEYTNDILPSKIMAASDFSLKKKIVIKEERREKPGLWNRIKRSLSIFFSADSGYEIVRREEEIVDVESQKKSLKGYVKKFGSDVDKNLSRWGEQNTIIEQAINKEIERIEQEYEIKKQNNLAITQRKDIANKLSNILDKYCFDSNEQVMETCSLNPPIINNDERKRVACSPIVHNCYQISHYISQIPFRTMGAYCQKANENQAGSPIAKTLVFGEDRLGMLQFAQRFFGISWNEDQDNLFQREGLLCVPQSKNRTQAFIFLNESYVGFNADGIKKLGTQIEKNFNAYILANVIQVGAVKNNLRRSMLFAPDSLWSAPAAINWVAASFQDFTNGGNVREGIENLIDLQQTFKVGNTGLLLLNHHESVYSLALMHMQTLNNVTQTDEKECLEKLKRRCRDKEMNQQVADIIRTYVERKN